MNKKNTNRQIKQLNEVCISRHNGFRCKVLCQSDLLREKILADKTEHQGIPLKWIKVMRGEVKPVYRRRRKYGYPEKI